MSVPKFFNLLLYFFRRTGIVDDDIRPSTFFFDRKLCRFSTVEFASIPSTANRTTKTLRSRSIDENDFVTKLVPSDLEHHRRVQDGRLRHLILKFGDLLFETSTDGWVCYLLKVFQFDRPGGRRFEDDLCQRRSPHTAALLKHGFSPTVSNRLADIGLIKRRMSGGVAIEYRGSKLFQLIGNQTFSCGNSAHNANHKHLSITFIGTYPLIVTQGR